MSEVKEIDDMQPVFPCSAAGLPVEQVHQRCAHKLAASLRTAFSRVLLYVRSPLSPLRL
jgi:hypothetical protein